jgi:hypothetical protein
MRAFLALVAFLALLAGPVPVDAQDAAQDAAQDTAAATDAERAPQAPSQPRTGDAWIDAHLLDMDLYAARFAESFVDEIVRYHEAPRELVEAALAGGDMRPGDVYFACALARASGRSCRTVLEARREDPAAGWDAIAAGLDVAPAVYRRIRGDITESYVRWARPLDSGTTSRR